MSRSHKIAIRGVLATVSILMLAVLSTLASYVVVAQEIKREEAVYVPSAGYLSSAWNPFSPSVPSATYWLYPRLFLYDWYNDRWLPFIAEKYEFASADTVKIYIRPEARWSDGKPLTAYDVEYTYKLATSIGLGPGSQCVDYIVYMKAISDKVVEVKAKTPVNVFMFIQCAFTMSPMPKHIIEPLYNQIGDKIKEWKNDDLALQVVSGPYKLYYADTTRVIYVRIDDWWGKNIFGLPKPKYIVEVFYPDNPSANQALELGEADWSGATFPDIERAFDKGVGTWSKNPPYYPQFNPTHLLMNLNRKGLDNPAVRRAIVYAIPYKDIVEKGEKGYTAQASLSMIYDIVESFAQYINRTLCEIYWNTSTCKVETNLEIAKKILDEAGIIDRDGDGIRELPDGTELTFTISVPYGWTNWMIECEMIASNLKKIGIDVTTYFPDFSVWWNNLMEGTYDLSLFWGAGLGFDHPWNIYRYLLDPRLTPPAGNFVRYNNMRLAQLLDAIATTADVELRKKYYSEIQEMLYRDVPIIQIYYGLIPYAFNTKVWQGWPSEDYPYWGPTPPWDVNAFIALFVVSKSGESVVVPQWLKSIDEGGMLIPSAKLLNDLTAVAIPKITITSTVTTTTTVTVTSTIERTVTLPATTITTTIISTTTATTTTTVTQIDWSITAVVAIVLLIVGLAAEYFVLRARIKR